MTHDGSLSRKAFFGVIGAGAVAASAVGCSGGIDKDEAEKANKRSGKVSRRVMPASAFAQSVLLALNPDCLVSLVEDVPDAEVPSARPEAAGLPVTGSLSYFERPEEFVSAAKSLQPDMVLDVGAYPSMEEGYLDGLEAETGVPFVLVDANGITIHEALCAVADMLPDDGAAERLSIVSEVEDILSAGLYGVSESERIAVHLGVLGETVEPVLAVEESAEWRMLAEASARQWRPSGSEGLIVGDEPDLIVAAGREAYEDFLGNGGQTSLWTFGTAPEAGTVIPGLVASRVWLDEMSGFVQDTLGALWLGNFLYPDAYTCDIDDVACRFYGTLFGRVPKSVADAGDFDAKLSELRGIGRAGFEARRKAAEAALAAKGEQMARETDELNNRKRTDEELNELFDSMGGGTEEQRKQFLDDVHELYRDG